MQTRIRSLCALGACVVAACSPQSDGSVADQVATDSNWQHPVTEWGEPDLRGMWPIGHLTGVPLQRPPELGDRRYLTDEELAARQQQYTGIQGAYKQEIDTNKMGMGHWVEWGKANRLTSLIIDPPNGQLPALTAEGERRRALMHSGWMSIPFDHWTDFDNWDRCITRGLPASMLPAYYNNGVEILQSPGYVVVRLEMIHEARVIPLDRRARAKGPRKYLGDARGWWEDNTLVVETSNFLPETAPQGATEQVVMTERFTAVSPAVVEWRVTFEDPNTWTRPWTYVMPLTKVDHTQQVFEYACHEGNHAMRNILSAARAEEK